jgi:hypothetical protein
VVGIGDGEQDDIALPEPIFSSLSLRAFQLLADAFRCAENSGSGNFFLRLSSLVVGGTHQTTPRTTSLGSF